MNQRIKVRKAEVKEIIKATFPNYRGRKFVVEFAERVTFHNLNWSGGTRNVYKGIASNGKTVAMAVQAPWAEPREGATIDVPVDVLVVKHTEYCGTDLGITIYAHPSNASKWLEEAAK